MKYLFLAALLVLGSFFAVNHYTEHPKPSPLKEITDEGIQPAHAVVLKEGQTRESYYESLKPKSMPKQTTKKATPVAGTLPVTSEAPIAPEPIVQPSTPATQSEIVQPTYPKPSGIVTFTKVEDRVEVSFSGDFDTVSFTLERPGSNPFAQWGERSQDSVGVGSYSMEPGDYPYHATFKKGTDHPMFQQVDGVYTAQ